MMRVLLIAFAGLAILGNADTFDNKVDDTVDDAVDEKAATCLTVLPEAASKLASKQAQTAAEKKHKELLEVAAQVYADGKAHALQVEKDSIANAQTEKTAGLAAANAQYVEKAARADAEAKKIIAHDMAQVDAKVATMKRDAVAATKAEMDAITWKHTQGINLENQAAEKSAKEGAVMAHIAQTKMDSLALDETKRGYIKAAKKHKHVLEDIAIEERNGKNNANVRAIKTRQEGRRDAEVKKEELVKVAERRFREKFESARAIQKAAVADADVTRTAMLTDSIAKAKTEEMTAWVDAMVLAMDTDACPTPPAACASTDGSAAAVATCTCASMTCAIGQKCTVTGVAPAATGACAAALVQTSVVDADSDTDDDDDDDA